jgi:hypothetical protein
MPILVRAISIEKRVPETLLFGAPSFQFSLRTRLRSLPPAPFNASEEGGVGMCQTLKNVREPQARTTRKRLLQIFEILPPAWLQAIHDWPPCKADKKDRRRPPHFLGERARKDSIHFSGITRKHRAGSVFEGLDV